MKPVRAVWKTLNHILSLFESFGSRREVSGPAPLTVFILAPPRSGSTLLFQVLASGTSLGYFTNLSSAFFGFPGTVAWVLKLARSHGVRLTRYRSVLGMGRGIFEPSEAGSWWKTHIRGWPTPDSMDSSKVVDPDRFVYSLRRSSRPFDDSLLVKNLYVIDHLPSFFDLLPDCFFIVLSRNVPDNARSLAAADLGSQASALQLFSMTPPGLKILSSEDHHSFSERRILATHQHIDEVLGSLGVPESRICRLDFDRVKSNPLGAVSDVAAMLEVGGKSVKVFAHRIPHRFD